MTRPEADTLAPDARGEGTGIRVLTFGCRLNTLESEVMRAEAAKAGLTDAILVNTCAVTAEATRQARQAIRKARRDHPDTPILVTGCAAQVDPEAFAAMPEVSRVIGNAEKLGAAAYAPGPGPRVSVGDIMALRETAGHLVDGLAARTRALVEVQTGCDHRCTFCIIPYGRGPSRSVPAGAVVEAVRRLVANGTREVVLTGVDLTSYGADLPGAPALGLLVRRILRLVPELPRLRLSSLDAVEIDPALLDALAEEERLMPHLHLSLQAGDDMILKRMKRRHARADAIALCERVRALRPDVAFGADLIAGFPTETEEMFAQTLDLVDACGLSYTHVFPFSPRAGTPAERMPQLPREVVKARAARLREAGARALAARLAERIGETVDVLAEEPGEGRTPGFACVRFASGLLAPGEIRRLRITGASADHLTAEAP